MTVGSEAPNPARLESTYKARDLESALDLYLYRPLGYLFARAFGRLRFTPSMVSLLGAGIGVIAGHLYFYRDLRANLAGMALHILTNVLDNADGQLARLTNRGSLHGAIMDGLADYIVFLSVYVHLCLRYVAEGGSGLIWSLALVAGISHAVQSMMIDFYRNGYLQFVVGRRSADANSSEVVRRAFDLMSWGAFWKKVALRSYLNYARQQEMLGPELVKLRIAAGDSSPSWLAHDYRALCLPLVKWCNCLATNPRMLVLFVLLLLGWPVWYFGVEITLLNLLLLYVMVRHSAIFRLLRTRITASGFDRKPVI